MSGKKSILETSASGSDTQSQPAISLSTESEAIEHQAKESKDCQKITRSSRGKTTSTSSVSSTISTNTTNNSQSPCSTVMPTNVEGSTVADGNSKSPITTKTTPIANVCTAGVKDIKEIKCPTTSIEVKTRGSSRVKVVSIESSLPVTAERMDDNETVKELTENSSETKIKIQLDNNTEKSNEKTEAAEEVTKAVSSPLRRTARKRISIPEKTQQKPTIVTRKSAAMDLAATTRSTRARRNSLEPMKGATRKATKKQFTVAAAITEPASKRKRTDSIRSDDRDEREIKIIKLELPEDENGKANIEEEFAEVKDDDHCSQETKSEDTLHEFDIELKLELIDQSEDDRENGPTETSFQDSENSTKIDDISVLSADGSLSKGPTPSDKSHVEIQGSTIKRPTRRKLVNTSHASPSTYATRRRNELPVMKTKCVTNNATYKKRGYVKKVDKSLLDVKDNENTKDESLTSDSCEKEKQSGVDINENASDNLQSCEPLTVDISTSAEALKEPEPCSSNELTASSEKAASLSPELISEGVSEISVKQFYKKPEFLENNLGIEEDPKLGEIMQNAEKDNGIKIVSIEQSAVKNELESIPPLEKQNDLVNPIQLKESDDDKSIKSSNEIDVNKSVDCIEDNTIVKMNVTNDDSLLTNIVQATEEDKDNCDNLLEHDIKIKDIEKLPELSNDEEKLEIDDDTKSENLEIDNCSTEILTDDCKKFEIKILDTHKDETKEDIKEDFKKSEENPLDEGQKEVDVTNEQNDEEIELNNIILPLTENDETLRQKEKHLKTLGLLSLKAAAVQVEQDKTKRRKIERTFQNALNNANKKINAGTNGTSGIKLTNEYTGTLKTVIKLNRKNDIFQPGTSGDQKRNAVNGGASSSQSGNNGARQSLKITFQKGRARGSHLDKDNQATISPEDTYYTIQNENEGLQTVIHNSPSVTHARKSINRNNATAVYQIIAETVNNSETNEAIASSSNNKKDDKQAILIPEKASSFSIHPERLCQDQCYYCGGKFGLYDTPCHVAQIKSAEKQQKILENEEKLLVDNCLCDACFRHVDRRANAPSYKKRLSAPGSLETVVNNITQNSSGSNDVEESLINKISNSFGTSNTATICFIPDCQNIAAHSLRRKCIRKTVKKLFFNFDMSSIGTFVQVCAKHYEAVMQYLGCALCKRRLGKNQIFYVTADTTQVEKLLADQGLPVQLQYNNSFCKLCRYYINLLLQQPQHSKEAKQEFIRNYRRRLLQFFNIQLDETSEIDGNEEDDESHLIEEINPPISKRSKKTDENSLIESNLLKTHKTSVQTCSPESSNSSAMEQVLENSQPRNTTCNRIVLENDVMVDYDVPMISDSSSNSPPPQSTARSKLQSILQQSNSNKDDISLVLRSNPNISMRELFPGEEDLGLHINVPFGSSSSQKTPEGWTRVQTFLQYDEPTRQLWEDLQKPYGNQSSFLRHLILLEKYYRNGDLVLSQNANSNATVYSNTIQNRLQSFDNIACEELPSSRSSTKSNPTPVLSRSNSVEKLHKQLLSNSVTITTRPKESTTKGTIVTSPPSTMTTTDSSRTILKSNLLNNKTAIEIVPITSTSSNNNDSNLSNMSKQQKLIEAANKLIGNSNSTQSSLKAVQTIDTSCNQSTTPPELVSLNKRQATSISVQHKQRSQTITKASTSRGGTGPLDVIILPDTLSAQERMQSKHWRPTLMPVTSGAHLNHQGPLYQTADGRRLPAMVQVQSGKRPFLISVHDYNRMCILRREKLLRDQMLKAGKLKSSGNVSANNLNCNNQYQQRNCNNQIQSKTNSNQNSQKKNLSTSLNSRRQSASFVPIAPKPPPYNFSGSLSKTITSNNQIPNQVVSGQSSFFPKNNSQVPLFQNSVSSTVASSGGLAISSVASLSPWMWNKTSDSNQLQNGIVSQKSIPSSTMTSGNLSGPIIPSNVTSILKRNLSSSTQGINTVGASVSSSIQFDTNLLSKIPKSLTVIPQHKMMAITTTQFKNTDSNNSIEDFTNT